MKSAGVNVYQLCQYFDFNLGSAVYYLYLNDTNPDIDHLRRVKKFLENAVKKGDKVHWDTDALNLIGQVYSANPTCLLSRVLSCLTGVAHPHATGLNDMYNALDHVYEAFDKMLASSTVTEVPLVE